MTEAIAIVEEPTVGIEQEEVLSQFRPVMMFGRSRIGKTTCCKQILQSIGGENIVVGGDRKDFVGMAVECVRPLLRELMRLNVNTLVEDLPRLHTKNVEKNLMRLLTYTGHTRSNVICTSQTDVGVMNKFLKQFKIFVFFSMEIDYNKWRKILRNARDASFLKKRVESLPSHEYILLDMETGAWWNAASNLNVKRLVKGMSDRLDGKLFSESAYEDEVMGKSKPKSETTTNALATRAEQVAKLLSEGKSREKICTELGITATHLRVILNDLKSKAGRRGKEQIE